MIYMEKKTLHEATGESKLKIFTKICAEVLQIMHLEQIYQVIPPEHQEIFPYKYISELNRPYIPAGPTQRDSLESYLTNLYYSFHHPFRMQSDESNVIVLKDMVNEFLEKLKPRVKNRYEEQKETRLDVAELMKLIFDMFPGPKKVEDDSVQLRERDPAFKLRYHHVLMECRLFLRLMGLALGMMFRGLPISELDYDDVIFEVFVNDHRFKSGKFFTMKSDYNVGKFEEMSVEDFAEIFKNKHKMAMDEIDILFEFFKGYELIDS